MAIFIIRGVGQLLTDMLRTHHISQRYPPGQSSWAILLPGQSFSPVCFTFYPLPLGSICTVPPIPPISIACSRSPLSRLHRYCALLYRRFSPFCPYYRHNPELLLRDGSQYPCPREHLQNLSSRSGGLLDVVVDLDFKPLLEQTHWK